MDIGFVNQSLSAQGSFLLHRFTTGQMPSLGSVKKNFPGRCDLEPLLYCFIGFLHEKYRSLNGSCGDSIQAAGLLFRLSQRG